VEGVVGNCTVMFAFLIRRILGVALTIFVITLITFTLTQIIPGDPARAAAGFDASAEAVERIREEMGLNKPVFIQYAVYISRLLSGDLGRSIVTRRPVLHDLVEKVPASVELALFSTLIWLPLGLVVGVYCAVNAGSWSDLASRVVSIAGVSMPVFWLALLIQLLLGRVLPIAGRLDVALALPRHTGFYLIDSLIAGSPAAFRSALAHLLPPALTLSLASIAKIGRMTRSCMLEVLGQDYVRTARAKGLGERTVIFRHALRNALIPITTIVGMQVGDLVAWVFLVEVVFAWPGIGRYGVSAIVNLDYPALIGTVLVTCVSYALLNFGVDLLYGVFNPRVKYSDT